MIDTTNRNKEMRRINKKLEYDEELCSDQGSIMNEQSEEGTAPDYDESIFDNEPQSMIPNLGEAQEKKLSYQKPNEFMRGCKVPDHQRNLSSRPTSLDDLSDL